MNVATAASQMQAKLPAGVKVDKITYRINMTSLMMSYDNNKHKYFTAGIRSNLNNISNG